MPAEAAPCREPTEKGEAMNHTGEKSTNSFALGLLIGAAAGAGLALLFAPKAGSELRGQIGESVSSWKDAAGRKVREVTDRASATMGDLQSSMSKTNPAPGSVTDAVDASRSNGRTRL